MRKGSSLGSGESNRCCVIRHPRKRLRPLPRDLDRQTTYLCCASNEMERERLHTRSFKKCTLRGCRDYVVGSCSSSRIALKLEKGFSVIFGRLADAVLKMVCASARSLPVSSIRGARTRAEPTPACS